LPVAIICAAAIEAARVRSKTAVIGVIAVGSFVLLTVALYLIVVGNELATPAAIATTGLHSSGNWLGTLLQRLINRGGQELPNLDILLTWYPESSKIGALFLGGIVAGAVAYMVRTRDFVAPLFASGYTAIVLLVPWQDGGYRYWFPLA